jgi:uncharacterized protein (DUF1499 family)
MAEGAQAAKGVKSWWARTTLIGSVMALALLLVGPIGTQLGLWGFQIGLLMIPGGVLLAAIGLLVGSVSIFVSRKRGFSSDMPTLFASIALCGVILLAMGMQLSKGLSVPPIHNISTDMSDPPEFNAVVALRGEGSNPLLYNADEIGLQQAQAYPDVTTLTVATAPDATLDRAVTALDDLGLAIVAVDPAAGIVEATATTFWFGFKDDVVVRIRASGAGSIVDVRSVSRVGVSDLGANAGRIMELLARLS